MVGYPDKWRDYSKLEDQARRSLRQRPARAAFNADYADQRSRQAGRPQEVGHEPADGERLQRRPARTRSCSRPASCRRRSSIRRRTRRSTTARSARSSATRSATASTTRAARSTPAGRSATGGPRRTRSASKRRGQGVRRAVRQVSRRRPGAFVNPKLTMGENIADFAGHAGRARRLSPFARRQARAGDRRPDRRPALLPRLRASVAEQAARGCASQTRSRPTRTARAASA